jgi:hypothetical protein
MSDVFLKQSLSQQQTLAPQMRKSLEMNGLTAILNTPKEQLDVQIKNESANWEKVIKARNIQAQ